MKRSNIFLIIFPIIAIALLLYFVNTTNTRADQIINKKQKPLEFKDNTLQCPQCHMYLVGKKDTAQIITADYKTHFFDDVGCAILWMRDQNIELESVKFWVFTRDTKEYINAYDAFYSLIDDTPMHYGFGAYAKNQSNLIDFNAMRLKMLRGENLSDPKIRKNLLGS
ncbi:MAG: hypothetical protein IBX44_01910 [Sulfurospirillum sp.]|nr:hypothetical protein [Sulfurospirillum sp.]